MLVTPTNNLVCSFHRSDSKCCLFVFFILSIVFDRIYVAHTIQILSKCKKRYFAQCKSMLFSSDTFLCSLFHNKINQNLLDLEQNVLCLSAFLQRMYFQRMHQPHLYRINVYICNNITIGAPNCASASNVYTLQSTPYTRTHTATRIRIVETTHVHW